MDLALALTGVAVTVVAVAGLSARLGLPAPLTLLVVGAIGSYLTFLPEVTLSSDVVLVGLLPPLLYAAAIRTSLLDFRDNRAAILALSVGLVLFTAAGVGLVVWWLLPVPFAVAFALGAVVAPPDAVAATAVARRIGLPRRVVTILEGESLVNDATALVALRTAVAAFPLAAATGGAAAAGAADSSGAAVAEMGKAGIEVVGEFAWAVVGGIVVGVAIASLLGFVRKHVTTPTLDTALSFLAPYLAYLPAESAHASGVLAVVVTGVLLGHKSPVLQNAASRLSERINWASVQFLLENGVFLLVGLQVSRVVADVGDSPLGLGRITLTVLAVLVTTIALRPAWVFALLPLLERGRGTDRYGWRQGAVTSWAGMRGVVTLAAALALPESTPHRSVLVLTALAVACGTLLLQGPTLPALARYLHVHAPSARQDALQEAIVLQRAVIAGKAALAELDVDEETKDTLRQRSVTRVNHAWERLGRSRLSADLETPSEAYRRGRLATLAAERAEVLRLRDAGAADHEVLSAVLDALDIEESMLERIGWRDERLDAHEEEINVAAPESLTDQCEHLSGATVEATPRTPEGCEDCLREGSHWVHLRLCLTCGHVGCCDSSPRRHARAHAAAVEHPVVQSFEPGETWRWCYVDNVLG